ncbi:MAG: hypothetical protein WBB48_08585 [Thermodesulfobacteriota bacterium]
MTKQYSLGSFNKIVPIVCLMLVVISCSSGNDPNQELTSYCIRECVIETSASEICDTECKCAAEKLSSEYSKEDFANLVQAITQDQADSIKKLKNSLESCRN